MAEATQAFYSNVVAGYLRAITWSSMDDESTPYDDAKYSETEWADEALDKIVEECHLFVSCADDGILDLDPEQVGHDFCLTRDHHGTGFWDRGLGELGDALATLAEKFGDSGLYEGDDGKFYVS